MLINTSNVNFFKIRLAHSCKIPTTIGVLISLLCTGYFYVMKSEIEIWKPVSISPFEGLYEVSNFGKVKSVKRLVKGNNSYVLRGGKILSPIKAKLGYLTVHLSLNGESRKIPIHRLVAIAFVKNQLKKPQVNHIDGNKQNNHYTNLEWVTAQENILHCHRTGLHTLCKGGVSKKIQQVSDKGVIKNWDSIQEAANSFNSLNSQSARDKIRKSLNSEGSKTAFNYNWFYAG